MNSPQKDGTIVMPHSDNLTGQQPPHLLKRKNIRYLQGAVCLRGLYLSRATDPYRYIHNESYELCRESWEVDENTARNMGAFACDEQEVPQ